MVCHCALTLAVRLHKTYPMMEIWKIDPTMEPYSFAQCPKQFPVFLCLSVFLLFAMDSLGYSFLFQGFLLPFSVLFYFSMGMMRAAYNDGVERYFRVKRRVTEIFLARALNFKDVELLTFSSEEGAVSQLTLDDKTEIERSSADDNDSGQAPVR